ncbi:MAG: hypothetical protein R3E31_22195 [Chloroflexota bacterium]
MTGNPAKKTSGPDHATLHRFEVYLYIHHPRLVFDTVLRQIDAAFPDDRRQTQVGDTFALHANAALESLITRLRHLGPSNCCWPTAPPTWILMPTPGAS